MRQTIPPRSRSLAKTLRANGTDAERRLWQVLRAHRLGGLKFRRQVPINGYIVDFVCFELKLIVEADGGQHADSVSDMARDAHFAAAGFRTLRFWNNDILANLDGVATEILRAAGRSFE